MHMRMRTQFLPQDKVVEFARMDPYETLTATEKAVGDASLHTLHTELVAMRNQHKEDKTVRSHGWKAFLACQPPKPIDMHAKRVCMHARAAARSSCHNGIRYRAGLHAQTAHARYGVPCAHACRVLHARRVWHAAHIW